MKYDIELHIIVEADSFDDAFAKVRSHYAVINDPHRIIQGEKLGDLLVDMHVNSNYGHKLSDDATIEDFA